ncbi:MAG: AAA family ATPase [Micromonosporaceae bacterium]|nr:AAA family ATPase [Micromonosporaceae bacterium]
MAQSRPSSPAGSESTRESEIAAEQRHVDRVYARLEALREQAQRLQREGFRLARARTPGSLVERDAMVYHAALRLRTLDTEYEGLVFGRLDLRNGETRHIGRLGLRDEEHRPLVIDWRAPGAAPFYQATAEDPQGVVRRRVIRCTGPRVVDIEDDLLDLEAATAGGIGAVGDGALLATLARAKTDRMRDIVATIQREQDEAIRAPAGGVTIIEGGPGTGKTAVALHRAAHLLYRDRRRYEGAGVLLVGPSPVFMSYVDRVLPSLGEETAELRALGEIVDGIATDRLDPPRLAALKGSLRMRRFLQRVIRQEPPGVPTSLRVTYAGEVLRLDADDLAAVRRRLHEIVPQPNPGGPEARRQLAIALWHKRPPGVAWTTKAFSTEIYGRDDFEEFARAWWPVLRPVAVLGWLADPARVRDAGGDWLSEEDIAALAESWASVGTDPADPSAGLSVADVALVDELRVLLGEPPKPVKRRESSRRLGIDQAGDDIQELSTVAERYFSAPARPPRPENYDGYAHVLVDEAQDVSPMQWRMLGRRGGQAGWTIVGDAAQSAWPDPDEAHRARQEALRGKKIRRFHLTTNYRNSAEIFDFAASVVRRAVPDADLPRAVRRTGAAPEHRLVAPDSFETAVVDAVSRLLGEVEGRIGVVTPAARRDAVATWLAGQDGSGRVQVVDAMRAKGMEYDGVVVVGPDEIVAEWDGVTEAPSARTTRTAGAAGTAAGAGIRVLYVALTRATHRLVTIATSAQWRGVDTSAEPA